VSNEIPLLMGLEYHLAVHTPYRPLRALLASAVEAYIDAAESGAAAASTPAAAPPTGSRGVETLGAPGDSSGGGGGGLLESSDPAFVPAWDALQARAFALADVALTTDAPLLYPPAVVAAACLVAAARPASSLARSHGEGDMDADAVPAVCPTLSGWWDDAALSSHAPSAVTAFVEPFVRRAVLAIAATAPAPGAADAAGISAAAPSAASAGEAGRSRRRDSASSPSAALDHVLLLLSAAFAPSAASASSAGGSSAAAATASGPEAGEAWEAELSGLLARLQGARDPAFTPGTAAYSARRAAAVADRDAYKSEKLPAREAAAAAAKAAGLL